MQTCLIYPEFDKIKGISPLWDNDYESIPISKSEYDQIEKFIKDTPINDKIDNICYILLLLKEEKTTFDLNDNLIDQESLLDEDLIQVSKFLQISDKDKNYNIGKIKFDIRKFQGYNPDKNEYTYSKKGSFYIQNPDVITEILKVVLSKYRMTASTNADFKSLIRMQKAINKPTILRKRLAQNLYNYFTKYTDTGENMKYFAIGFLFQLSGLENKLSEKDYTYKVNHSHTLPYKSYPDFVTTNIRNKYFKGGRKIQ